MAAILPTILVGAAGVALAASLWQIGTRVRALESQRVDLSSPGDQSGAGARSSKPMLAALYREPGPSPLRGLTALPGGAWLGAALMLAIVGLSLSGFAPANAPASPPAPDSAVVKLQGQVDSLSVVVAALRDSVRLVATPTQVAKVTESKQTRRKAERSGVVLPAPVPPP